MIRAVVLGAGAGGGFPQWNSGGAGCRRARAGDPACRPRTQCGLAVTGDDRHWFLVNASPDLPQQLRECAMLHPAGGVRSSPVAGVVLCGGEVDAVAGLLSLRERHPFRLHATAPVLSLLDANPIFEVLDRAIVSRHAEMPDEPFPLRAPDGTPAGLTATLFAVPGKAPLYREAEAGIEVGGDGTSAGLALSDGTATLFFVPGCAAMTPALRERLRGAALLLFDGTLWDDEEMRRGGLGPKTGRRMGHMPVSGPGGTLDVFADGGAGRRVLIHLNNSNPLLQDDSPERAEAARAGWEVAFDGMELVL
ncbi:pyrroloquinoline quinone biosynthesis protein PqqB [Rhizosaccharibacter radicis]|uniref:Coenzyme PQQ synthesis protein B n=1 Tax=Rhizosaccharibacter radicis TaxID=2782605 RepID=A0ABT1VZL4_9PROT|nr:pyrroloquinoline quinone biosynthesis protein PqqB [Acetobacteraceae bacterium KSS12]